jgi:putative membrane protein
MIDYITLLLVNSAAGLLAGAIFLCKGLSGPEQNHRPWAAVFAAAGLLSFVMGVHMSATWPVKEIVMPAQAASTAPAGDHAGASQPAGNKINLRFANVAFGETCAIFGALMLGLALSLAKGWSLVPIAVYAAITGAASVTLGAAILSLGLTAKPPMAAAGFLLAGVGAILALPAVWRPTMRGVRMLAAILLALAALVWLATGLPAYWMHMQNFSK